MKCLLASFLFLSQIICAQSDYEKLFGAYEQPINWQGDINKFSFINDSTLQLFDTIQATSAVLYSQVDMADSMFFQSKIHFGFNPSSSNYAKIFLSSQSKDDSNNGICVVIGAANDNVELCTFKNGKKNTHISSENSLLNTSTVDVWVRVIKKMNSWTLYTLTDSSWIDLGSVEIDNSIYEYPEIDFLKIECVYTKTRFDKIGFNNFIIVKSESELPSVVKKPEASPDDNDDKNDNAYKAKRFDVVFTEIMPDPTPIVGLPDCEYVEIYNRSNNDIDLDGWTLQAGKSMGKLSNYVIKANSYLLLCPKSAVELFNIDNVTSPSSWPAIANNKSDLLLTSKNGQIIDALKYSSKWFNETFKDDGGWAFERVDNDNFSGNESNWKYSLSAQGGSPGKANSIAANNIDNYAPKLVFANIENDNRTLNLRFNECMKRPKKMEYITANLLHLKVDSVVLDTVFLQNISIILRQPLDAKVDYEVQSTDIEDFNGNKFIPQNFHIGVAEAAEANDLIINEIMFDTNNGYPKFVEILNISDKVIDLSSLRFCIMSDDKIASMTNISESQRLIFNGNYIGLTSDSLACADVYQPRNPQWIVNVPKFPNLVAKEGSIAITTPDGVIVDKLYYNTNMHSSLISNKKNVSLERVSEQVESRWTSAAESAGFQTVTDKNSQFIESEKSTDELIRIPNKVFTPNGDGEDDELIIYYSMPDYGWNGTLRIYSSNGRLIRVLVNNQTLSSDGYWLWNGSDEDGNRLSPGTYIILFEGFNADGDSRKVKNTCVLGVGRR